MKEGIVMRLSLAIGVILTALAPPTHDAAAQLTQKEVLILAAAQKMVGAAQAEAGRLHLARRSINSLWCDAGAGGARRDQAACGVHAAGFGKIDLRIDPVPALCDGECTEPRNPCGLTHDRAGREMGAQSP